MRAKELRTDLLEAGVALSLSLVNDVEVKKSKDTAVIR
jgi:hypothetical protein